MLKKKKIQSKFLHFFGLALNKEHAEYICLALKLLICEIAVRQCWAMVIPVGGSMGIIKWCYDNNVEQMSLFVVNYVRCVFGS